MNVRFVLRLARVLLHLVLGLCICALLFPWAGTPLRERLVRGWSRALLGICGVALEELPGAAALPHAMIVANHVSWLDIFVINSMHPCRFVAKAEIRAWPVVGWLVEKAGTVFISRGNRRELRHLFKALVARLHAGQRIAFFPEGTTAAQGALLPFHANLFEAAIDAPVPVQPYALRYVDGDGKFHRAVDYLDETTFVQSMLAILRSGGVRAQLRCLAPLDAAGAHRRELAQAAQAAIAGAVPPEGANA